MKVLNLYANIGGNRKLWKDVEVTAVERDAWKAEIYKDLFPNDTVIVGDAHDFLLHHHNEYDFVWTSPVCKTHSRTNYFIRASKGVVRYPDLSLYQEILLLQAFHRGKFCVENVKPYYEPLVPAQVLGRHLIWTNFRVPQIHVDAIMGRMSGSKKGLGGKTQNEHQVINLERSTGINLDKYGLSTEKKAQLLRDTTNPKLGEHILNCARGSLLQTGTQSDLFSCGGAFV